jgi:hypothetical protein
MTANRLERAQRIQRQPSTVDLAIAGDRFDSVRGFGADRTPALSLRKVNIML